MEWIQRHRVGMFLLAAVCLFVLGFAFIIFMYNDLTNTVDNANILLKAIRWGRITEFYDLSVKYSQTNFAANYNFPVYVLFAIWQLPAYIITYKLGINYLESPVCMLWSKMLVLLFVLLSAHYIYKIVLLCCEKKQKGKLAVFLYLSSGFVFYSVFICGQLEVISTSLMLGGLYYYLQKKDKLFYLFFVLSVPFKLFTLFLALPLLVYKEKNIIKVLVAWLGMGLPVIVEKVIFRSSPIYRYALYSQNRDATVKLMNAEVSIGRPISVFILLYIGLVVYLYLSHNVDNRTVIYSSFFVWAVFVVFCGINTYWVYLLAPFVILAICVNDRFERTNILIETVSSLSYIISIACMGTAIFQDKGILTRLFYPGIFSVPAQGQLKYQTVDLLFTTQGWKTYYTLFSTAFVGGVILLLLLTLPKIQTGSADDKIRGIVWLRPVILIAVSGLIIYASTSQTNKIAFDTRNYETAAAECNLIDPVQDNCLKQKVVFPDSRKLDSIILKFHNTHCHRSNMALLRLELLDENDACIFEDYRGCCAIGDKEEIKINLRGTAVQAGKTYTIKLSGLKGNEYYWKQESLYPYICTITNQISLENISINDTKTENTYLWFEIR